MKILHLIKTGEGATWAYRQIQVLIEQGAEVAVCIPKGKYYDQYRKDGVRVYEFNYSLNPAKLLFQFKTFKKILKDFKPDIIHSHFVLTTLFTRFYRRLFKLPLPLIFQVPGPLHLEHLLFRQADIKTGKNEDYWIASCKWTENRYVRAGIPKDKVFLSYYGTDLNYFKKHAKGKLRSELGLMHDDFIVAMVAFMYPPKPYLGQKRGIKGHEDFFEAMSQCIHSNKKMKAVIVGGAWNGAIGYEDKLIKMGKELCGDNIYFLGTRKDVPELYADIDLVVHPSYSENLGGAIESLILEVPTIATNVGGFPDIVIDGETGFLVKPGIVAELKEVIEKSYNEYSTVKEMAKLGCIKTKQILDVQKTGREVYTIYQQILERAN